MVHPLKAAGSYRAKVQRWYGSKRWKAIRAAQLAAEPLCRMCTAEGKTTSGRIADHVIPHKGDDQLFWHGELQSLCKRHHDSDKALIEAGKAPITYGEDGWPVSN